MNQAQLDHEKALTEEILTAAELDDCIKKTKELTEIFNADKKALGTDYR